MAKVTPRTLSGFMELLPEKQAQMELMLDTLRKSYSLFGFTALDTPAIESAEVLLAKGGGETEKQIYRFNKGDSDLALRFDLTVPLAKYVAANQGKLNFPFRRYQIGKVWRGERAQRGRFREFYQADIDIIGDGKLDTMNDAEIPAVICHTFKSLGLTNFTIRMNNRKILNGFFEILGLEDSASDIMRTIDKLDKIGVDKTLDLLATDCLVGADTCQEIINFISFKGSVKEKLDFLAVYLGKNETYDEGFRELTKLVDTLPAFGVDEKNYDLDITIARGLDYYTGMVYETMMNDFPEIGSICSGGRYDNLAEYYTDKKLPGVGISIGLTRLFYVLDEQGLINSEVITAPCDALVIPMVDDFAVCASVATVLREANIRTQIFTENKKFKQKMSYADKISAPFVVIIGEDEVKQGVVSLKNMETGEQITVTAIGASEIIKTVIEEKRKLNIIKA